MAWLKTQEEIDKLREIGSRHAKVFDVVRKAVRPGVSTKELNDIIHTAVTENGDNPSLLNYKPDFAATPFPASVCISINDEVVHGIPSKDRILQQGDIVSFDFTVERDGLVTDSAITVPVGLISKEVESLLRVTEEALYAGIEAARAGNTIGDIGYAISSVAKPHKLGVIEELCGHGVGHAVHEEPNVPNFGKKGKGHRLEPGMVLALEPMFTRGSRHVRGLSDGYTIVTQDGSMSAHFEHTIAITEDEPIILTAK